MNLAQKNQPNQNSLLGSAMNIMLSSDLKMDDDEGQNKNLLESEEDASDEERDFEMKKQQTALQTADGQNTQPITSNAEVEDERKPKKQAPAEKAPSGSGVTAYVGASMYYKRMFPHGCPSYQKAFVKLFRVD